MTGYLKTSPAQSSVFGREVGRLLTWTTDLDCVSFSTDLIGAECAQRWSSAIRRVTVGDIAPDSAAIVFAAEPVHRANTPHERRFFALMMLIMGELNARNPRDARAWTKNLFRGVQHRWHVDENGEYKRKYHRFGKPEERRQGGLAARLGVCVRTIDRYLAVAKAAGLVSIWQKKKDINKLPAHLRGKKHAYACFRWLGELPRAVLERLTGRVRVPETAPSPPPSNTDGLRTAPAAEDVDWVARVRQGAVGRSRPPG